MKSQLLIAVAAPSLLLAGCATKPNSNPSVTPANALKTTAASVKSNTTSQTQKTDYVGQMSVSPEHGLIGSKVTVTAEHLPASTSYSLVWYTVKGSWDLQGTYHENFTGRSFQPVSKVLEHVKSNSSGRITASFSVPSGFGFDHTVSLVKDSNNVEVNQAMFKVDPQAALTSTHGAPGSPIQVTMKGIGAESYTNNWMVTYDNKFTGFISSVTTSGTAHMTIPAAGGPGKHIINIIHGAYTFPYLNTKQSPHPKPEFHLVYTVTKGKALLPKPLNQQSLPVVKGNEPKGTGTAAWVTPKSGPANQKINIHARALTPGKTVKITWSRMVGSHVTAKGYSEKTITLGKATVAKDGTLNYKVTPPADLGGGHKIGIVNSAGHLIASTTYTVTPTAISMNPQRGPDGTNIILHLNGVGWTDTANIYTVDYDNSYIGYACGFNSQGDIKIPLKATGQSGWHFIDLYPSIYKGKDIKGTDDFRLPQLTYKADHPGAKVPAFHFAFYVTGK